jgi:hypothetical protein
VYKYYVGEKVEVSWKCEKEMGPLLWDMGGLLGEGVERVVGEEMSVKKQLAYVLPKENSKYKLEWSFCKYLWEGHVVIEKDQIGLIN